MKLSGGLLLAFELLAVAAAFVRSFAVRVPLRHLEAALTPHLHLLLPLVGLRVALFALFGLYRPIWGRAALREFVAVASAVSAGSIIAVLLLVLTTLIEPIQRFPRAVILIEWALTLGIVAGSRYALRVFGARDFDPDLPEEDLRHRRVLLSKLRDWLLDAPPAVRAQWSRTQALSGRRVVKRLFDILVSLAAITALSPVYLLIAALIKLESPGPVLADTPRRAGRYGREFRMYKFRSMVKNAHLMLVNDPVLWEEYKKNNFKLPNDPRLTRVGAFLRRNSLDELPNFFNVLHGEMSMVGPRPRYPFEVVQQAERFPHTQPDILRMLTSKPGVTGPWQVSGRSNIGYEERTRLEAEYAETQALAGDITILVKTFAVVARKEGAH